MMLKGSYEEFKRFVEVRDSGVTNMFAKRTVCMIAGISEEVYMDILKNFGKYEELEEV